MDAQELELSLAKSMHWNFSKLRDDAATPKWAALDRETRVLWLKMARRTIRRVEKLQSAETAEA